MKPARVAIFDDHQKVRETFSELLTVVGHEVVGTAASVEEGIELIDSLEPGSVDVALVDGDLGGGRENNGDGAIVAGFLRASLGDTVRIIGISAGGHVVGVDDNIPKTQANEIFDHIESI